MNRDDVIRMAREAGILETMGYGNPHMKAWQEDVVRELSHFAALVAAAAKAEENEACAQFLESTQLGSLPDDTALHYARLLKGFAEGIRARGQS